MAASVLLDQIKEGQEGKKVFDVFSSHFFLYMRQHGKQSTAIFTATGLKLSVKLTSRNACLLKKWIEWQQWGDWKFWTQVYIYIMRTHTHVPAYIGGRVTLSKHQLLAVGDYWFKSNTLHDNPCCQSHGQARRTPKPYFADGNRLRSPGVVVSPVVSRMIGKY